MKKLKRTRIRITGRVQGVGFRPLVYRYAVDHALSGFVENTPEGVFIEVEGETSRVNSFINRLKETPPPLSKIRNFETTDVAVRKIEKDFRILLSNNSGKKDVEISPDLAICPDCLNDIRSPGNRRFRYPFTNCTNCGPRFSIIKDRPYDRKFTSMGDFPMCKECLSEYGNPLNRRFHAQPNACPECGPSLHLINAGKKAKSTDLIQTTAGLIKKGKIAAVKGLGGFNILIDPFNKANLKRLRKSKNRPNKAFALMAKNTMVIKKYCLLSKKEEAELTSAAAPIVLLRKKNTELDHISPDNNYLGIILPYTPLHHLLMEELELLVFTSANKADEPISINDDGVKRLIEENIIDFALSSNRDIINRCDDSIVQYTGNLKQTIRRSRGFVPAPVVIEAPSPRGAILAFGADLKNCFSIRKKNEIYNSQHIGDMKDSRNYEYQRDQIKRFKKLLGLDVKIMISDAHPGYENYNMEYTRVFHHHAHMLSVIGEHNIKEERVPGIICDGTGYGNDGKLWGFEFLEINGNLKEFKRLCHLEYFPLPGGERALYEIDRIGISISRFLDDINCYKRYGKKRVDRISKLIDSGINSPLTSSLGRLFDGVSSILSLCDYSEYEARGAILLQKAAENAASINSPEYDVKLNHSADSIIIGYREMIRKVWNDREKGIPVEEIALKFHIWIVNAIVKVISLLKPEMLVLSGGCFQNSLLTGLIKDVLDEKKIRYYFNSNIPVNDAGISFGQAVFGE